ncbi:10255_t:CDS:2 [Ambispora gerdemannii]|uniref:Methionine synthase reductase n=1 Tax=Ambispora gerdemannii TaxID=144530 RepID=A0A9N9BJY1_9GLOM|nr:10255_t:CDS:2 [Ambispora gerdemannii]
MSIVQQKSENYIILYASQTGNAEWIAKNIQQEANERGYSGECRVMDEYDKVDLGKIEVLIAVTSNTGDGDPPDNAIKFFRFLRKIKSKTFFENTKFTILGLGDTNYTNFNNTAKRLEKKFLELGGSVFYEKGLADDATGLESVVDPWVANLWPALEKVCIKKNKKSNGQIEIIASSVANISVMDNKNNLQSNKVGLENSLTIVKKDESIKTTATTSEKSSLTIVKKNESIKTTATTSENTINGDTVSKSTLNLRKSDDATLVPIRGERKGSKLIIDLSDLESVTQLTSLPRIPTTLCKITKLDSEIKKTLSNDRDSFPSIPSFVHTPTRVFGAKISAVRCLTHPNALKRTLHLELDIKDHRDNIEFVPGDVFGILAPNDEEFVWTLLKILGIDHDEAQRTINIEAVEGAGINQFNRLREQLPTLLELFLTFPSSKLPFERLLDVLPPHQPRYYSIANSPLVDANNLHIAFNVVYYNTPEPFAVPKWGICTPWLDELSGRITTTNIRTPLLSPIEIPIFMKPNEHGFAVPNDNKVPLIMIGPGTGIAPFIGFLQHREKLRDIRRKISTIGLHARREVDKQFGDLWLFYGCRDTEKDFLYKDELEGFVKRGVLKQLEVAVSRAPGAGELGKPKYVQDLIRIRGKEIYELVSKKGALIFVCGDAKGMAKGVNDALIDILIEQANMDRVEASKLLLNWVQEKRYIRDLWA